MASAQRSMRTQRRLLAAERLSIFLTAVSKKWEVLLDTICSISGATYFI